MHRSRRWIRTALAAVGALLALPWAAPSRAAELAVGDRAPAFALPGTDGEIHRLADSLGRRGVVLAWFPRAFTPG
jgi:peroxiredoxin Q/BCP